MKSFKPEMFIFVHHTQGSARNNTKQYLQVTYETSDVSVINIKIELSFE